VASEIFLTRNLTGLIPADDASRDLLRKFKLGSFLIATIRKPRNGKFHRKMFALLSIVWAAAGDWPTVEHLLTDLKLAIGHVEKRQFVNRTTGEVFDYIVPMSISYASMDDLEFEKFYERALMELCSMAGGIEADELREEVLNQLAEA
jgi:hypothetical protein